MKELSREINRYLMDLDNCTTERSEFDVLSNLETLISATTYELTHTRTGKSYFILATDEMVNDICKYIEKFRQENDLPGKEFYQFRMSATRQTLKMYMDVKARKKIKSSFLEYCVNNFAKSTIFVILGLDSTIGKDNIRYSKLLLRSEYEKFMNLRLANPEYFVPFIQTIIKEMKNMELYGQGGTNDAGIFARTGL